jgi:hypothetical protein
MERAHLKSARAFSPFKTRSLEGPAAVENDPRRADKHYPFVTTIVNP